MNSILPKLKNGFKNNEMIKESILKLIDKLSLNNHLLKDEYLMIFDNITFEETTYLYQKAYEAKIPYYQNRVFLRALIEISNYCKMGCKYCGINSSSNSIKRYRLSVDEILECCRLGFSLGYKTFVLQGGEDSFYTDDVLIEIISKIKLENPNTRVTLSIGERSKESYQKLYTAGADRYLLRHETASKRLYNYLHPNYMSFENRRECLENLKEIGFQVGAGFMVGTPTQTNDDLVEDLLYLKKLNPHMIGIGPYLCHEDTELRGNISGTLDQTLVMVALTRLTLPKVLLPATTALGTVDMTGREKGLKAGANVIMPNISPSENKKLYEIYQNKICTVDSSDLDKDNLESKVNSVGHVIDLGVGDYVDIERMVESDR